MIMSLSYYVISITWIPGSIEFRDIWAEHGKVKHARLKWERIWT